VSRRRRCGECGRERPADRPTNPVWEGKENAHVLVRCGEIEAVAWTAKDGERRLALTRRETIYSVAWVDSRTDVPAKLIEHVRKWGGTDAANAIIGAWAKGADEGLWPEVVEGLRGELPDDLLDGLVWFGPVHIWHYGVKDGKLWRRVVSAHKWEQSRAFDDGDTVLTRARALGLLVEEKPDAKGNMRNVLTEQRVKQLERQRDEARQERDKAQQHLRAARDVSAQLQEIRNDQARQLGKMRRELEEAREERDRARDREADYRAAYELASGMLDGIRKLLEEKP